MACQNEHLKIVEYQHTQFRLTANDARSHGNNALILGIIYIDFWGIDMISDLKYSVLEIVGNKR